MEEKEKQNQVSYEDMSTDELRELLRQDLENDILDQNTLDQIMTIIQQRNQREQFLDIPPIEKSWTQFQERLESLPQPTVKAQKQNPPAWIRTTSKIAAAMLALVLLVTVTASALSYASENLILVERNGTFRLISTKKFSFYDQELMDELKQDGITEPVVPTYIPDGYVYEGYKKYEYMTKKEYTLQFQNSASEKSIYLNFYLNWSTGKTYIEYDEGSLQVYPLEGINYYLATNTGTHKAVWITQNCECYLSGVESLDELRKIIDSIHFW